MELPPFPRLIAGDDALQMVEERQVWLCNKIANFEGQGLHTRVGGRTAGTSVQCSEQIGWDLM